MILLLVVKCQFIDVWVSIEANTTSNSFRTWVNYTCKSGYTSSDGEDYHIAYCTPSGHWIPSLVSCRGSVLWLYLGFCLVFDLAMKLVLHCRLSDYWIWCPNWITNDAHFSFCNAHCQQYEFNINVEISYAGWHMSNALICPFHMAKMHKLTFYLMVLYSHKHT